MAGNHTAIIDADALSRKKDTVLEVIESQKRPADLNTICGSSLLVERLTIKRVKKLEIWLKG
jgi:hypothetical protein